MKSRTSLKSRGVLLCCVILGVVGLVYRANHIQNKDSERQIETVDDNPDYRSNYGDSDPKDAKNTIVDRNDYYGMRKQD